MSIMQFFKRLIGGKPDAPLSGDELTRAIVRTGNLDWQGLPIDRVRGPGMEPPPWYRRMVSDRLARAGQRIENRQNSDIPGLLPNQFDCDSIASENARRRRPPADDWLRQGDAG